MNEVPEITEEQKAALLDKIQMQAPPTEGLPGLDLDKVDIPAGTRHLYEQAQLEQTDEGEKWVVVQDEWETRNKSYSGQGVDKNGEAKGLAGFLTQISNTGVWQIHSVLPNGSGMCVVVMRRKVKIVLPDPVPIEDTKVEAPTDAELVESETAAEKWAKEQGLGA